MGPSVTTKLWLEAKARALVFMALPRSTADSRTFSAADGASPSSTGHITHSAYWKCEGSRASTPGFSLPAMGCEPMKRLRAHPRLRVQTEQASPTVGSDFTGLRYHRRNCRLRMLILRLGGTRCVYCPQ